MISYCAFLIFLPLTSYFLPKRRISPTQSTTLVAPMIIDQSTNLRGVTLNICQPKVVMNTCPNIIAKAMSINP